MTKNDRTTVEKAGFRIFRGDEAPPLLIADYQGMTPAIAEGLARLNQAGLAEGADVRTVFEIPGFSLTYAWLKSDFPLPLHSHQGDCLYYITGGSLALGTEQLHKGDGFFVPANTPYTYRSGPQGVEVLEFRHHGCHDINIRAKTAAYWDKTFNDMGMLVPRWRSEKRPKSLEPAS
jgi:hypothetical protein